MQAIRDFRIGEGGLLRRCEKAVGLTTLRRQILTAISLTWVPVVALSLINERLTGLREPLVHAPSLHVRLLVAVPVLLTLDQVFPRVCRSALEQLAAQSFLPDSAQEPFDNLLRRSTRLADSLVPELLLALLAFGLGAGSVVGLVPNSALARSAGLSAAHIWYALADGPVLQFLLWRSLWRWAIWMFVLRGLAGLDLDLVAAHPDRRGGVSFLRIPSVGYCAGLLFAISTVLCSEQGQRLFRGVSLASFTPLLALFAAVGALLAFGPLLLFTPRLLQLRREGRVEYGALATAYARHFQREWIARGERAGQLTGATQPLADLTTVYRDTVDRLLPVLFDRRDLIALLVATLLPVVPVMLLKVPREDWKELLGLLTGSTLR
jgi:hypothetical protein